MRRKNNKMTRRLRVSNTIRFSDE